MYRKLFLSFTFICFTSRSLYISFSTPRSQLLYSNLNLGLYNFLTKCTSPFLSFSPILPLSFPLYILTLSLYTRACLLTYLLTYNPRIYIHTLTHPLTYIYIYIDTLIHGTYVVIQSYIHIYTHSCSYSCIYVYMSTAPDTDADTSDVDASADSD